MNGMTHAAKRHDLDSLKRTFEGYITDISSFSHSICSLTRGFLTHLGFALQAANQGFTFDSIGGKPNASEWTDHLVELSARPCGNLNFDIEFIIKAILVASATFTLRSC